MEIGADGGGGENVPARGKRGKYVGRASHERADHMMLVAPPPVRSSAAAEFAYCVSRRTAAVALHANHLRPRINYVIPLKLPNERYRKEFISCDNSAETKTLRAEGTANRFSWCGFAGRAHSMQ